MRILADENFPGLWELPWKEAGVEVLNAKSHDVIWVRTDAPGSRDEDFAAGSLRVASYVRPGEIILCKSRIDRS